MNLTNNLPALRTLNIRAHVPVDLNAILCEYASSQSLSLLTAFKDNAHTSLIKLYQIKGNNGNNISRHQAAAAKLKAAILDLTWCPKSLGFYDFNRTANARNTILTVATYYPPWLGIFPQEILTNETATQQFFAPVNLILSRYNGTFPTTFVETGLQWDAPNAWPPHIYIVMQALLSVPNNISSSPLPSYENGSWAALANNQLGLSESDLPAQPIDGGDNVSASGKDADISFQNGTWVNGGNKVDGEGWRDAIARGMAK